MDASRWSVALPIERGSSQRLGEVQDQSAADASRGEPPVCFGGLFRRQDISHSQCEDALFGLAPKPIEEGGVGG